MMKLKVPGSHWAWGQIFHSCTPNTKRTFILSLPWYFRCLKQNSPLSHARWVSSLLVFAILLWAELVGFPLEQSRQNSTDKISWFLRERSYILTTQQYSFWSSCPGRSEWTLWLLSHSAPSSIKNACTHSCNIRGRTERLWTNFVASFPYLTKILSAHCIINKQTCHTFAG